MRTRAGPALLTERNVTGRRHLVTLRRHDGRQGHKKLGFIPRVVLAVIAKASICSS